VRGLKFPSIEDVEKREGNEFKEFQAERRLRISRGNLILDELEYIHSINGKEYHLPEPFEVQEIVNPLCTPVCTGLTKQLTRAKKYQVAQGTIIKLRKYLSVDHGFQISHPYKVVYPR
jgi:hypothetical protein